VRYFLSQSAVFLKSKCGSFAIIYVKLNSWVSVDVFDALTSDRPYRKAWTKESDIEYIKSEAGKHFDPRVVDAFLKVIKEKE
jgi:hypothetical protein